MGAREPAREFREQGARETRLADILAGKQAGRLTDPLIKSICVTHIHSGRRKVKGKEQEQQSGKRWNRCAFCVARGK